MGNVESASGNDQNHWHGTDPNIQPSLRAPPVRGGKAPPHQLLLRKGSSFLDEPITSKLTERGDANVTLSENSDSSNGREGSPQHHAAKKLWYAVSEMQGWRSHMEDKHALNPKLSTSHAQAQILKDHHLFAVFDGHGGDFASHYCGEHFVSTLIGQKDWTSYLKLPSDKQRGSAIGLSFLKSALTSAFHELDTKLMVAQRSRRLTQLTQLENFVLQMGGESDHDVFQKGSEDYNSVLNFDRKIIQSMPANIPLERSGSTGVVVLVTPSHILCANAGDSRAILSKRVGDRTSSSSSIGKVDVLPLSFDHKPINDVEVCRVERDGGFVRNGRVDGDLAVSRSFGDFGYKNCSERDDGSMSDSTSSSSSEPKDYRVTVHPDLLVHIREPSKDEFLVLACDGIWDRLSNRDCAELVRTLVHGEGETDVGLICEEIIDTALELDSRDNMTCCVVVFPSAKMGSTSARNTSSSNISGVMKRRSDRERSWGYDSTPAKRAQLRLEERNKKRREVIALQNNKIPKNQGRRQRPQQALHVAASREQQEQQKGRKHKAPNQSPPRSQKSRNKTSRQ